MLFDVATSAIAGNKIRLAMRVGSPLLPGWVTDKEGTPIMEEKPVFNRDEFFQAPLGGTREQGSHKGYGFALMAEVLATMLAGALPTMLSPQSGSKNHFAAYSIEAFTDVEQFKDSMDAMLETLRTATPAPGTGSRALSRACPSTRRWRSAAPTAFPCTRKSSSGSRAPGRDGLGPAGHPLRRQRMKIKRVEHIAIAVNSLEQSINLLRDTFGLPLEYEEQIGPTRLAMLPVGQSYIELLEGQGPESGVTKWIAEKGTGLFHICFEVEDIDGALAELKAKGVKLRDETPRIGHGGARIAFIDPSSTGDVLIELAELPAGHEAHA